jgi:hypothetical protein
LVVVVWSLGTLRPDLHIEAKIRQLAVIGPEQTKPKGLIGWIDSFHGADPCPLTLAPPLTTHPNHHHPPITAEANPVNRKPQPPQNRWMNFTTGPRNSFIGNPWANLENLIVGLHAAPLTRWIPPTISARQLPL